MSFVFPAHLAMEATRSLANSALPDAPVEPEDEQKPRRWRFRWAARKAPVRSVEPACG